MPGQARGGCRVCWTPEPSSCRPRPHLPLPSNCNTSGTCPLWCYPEEGVGPHTLSTHPSREPHPGAGTASWPGGPRSAAYRGPPCARCVASARPLPDSGPQWTRWPLSPSHSEAQKKLALPSQASDLQQDTDPGAPPPKAGGGLPGHPGMLVSHLSQPRQAPGPRCCRGRSPATVNYPESEGGRHAVIKDQK